MARLLEQALTLVPDRVSVLTNLSVALLKLERPEEALIHAQKSVVLDPCNVDGWLNAGSAHMSLKRLDDALACYDRAVRINPAFADAWMNRGNILAELSRPEDALANYRRALALNSRNPEIHNNLGNVLGTLKQYDIALASYSQAIKLNPGYADAYEHRGDLLVSIGERAAALNDYQQALRLFPASPVYRLKHLIAGIPVIPARSAESGISRRVFTNEAAQLLEWINANRADDEHKAVGPAQPFYLAYQEENNCALLESYGVICTTLMRRWQEKLPLPGIRSFRSAGSKIRVGIVSAHIKNHSVWHALVKGWVKRLDNTTFEIRVFHLSADFDNETAIARLAATSFWNGIKTLQQWVDLVSGDAPDVLIYPDLCMDSMAIRLASLRLAPVQIAAWGHPETTGLPTMDYYLSAADFETAASQQNYSEKLVALPALGCCYDYIPVPDAEFDLTELGVNSSRTLFVCAGTPYKYAPEHDGIFTQIARKVPTAAFVFFTHHELPPLSKRLLDRLSACFGDENMDFARYAVVVPWQPKPRFYALLKQADVFLDTIGFSGFNTAMQAIECGLPIVAREGRFMRGRFASAILKRMNLAELVTHDDQSYVDCAVRLAQDKRYRDDIRRKIESARGVLYGDPSSIFALEEFLVGILKSR